MSFVHSTIIGHFDPVQLSGRNRTTLRPLDLVAARTLLAEYAPSVEPHVEFKDGYAECWWANSASPFHKDVYEYAMRLAKQQNCVAADTPGCVITYPDDAVRSQGEAWKELREKMPPPEPT